MPSAHESDQYGLIAGLYDHVALYRDRPDLEFYLEAARQAGSPVLELGSGTGRVLIPTARAGIEITGLDLSPSMLSVCRQRLLAESDPVRARVELVEGDMRRFDLGRSFNLVTVPFRAFQHLVPVEDQLACLGRVRRHLVPGGTLILDLFNPSLEALIRPVGVEAEDTPETLLPDGRRFTRTFQITSQDRAAQVNQVELIYHVINPNGRTERLVHGFTMRYLFRYEAEHLLVRAGFEIVAVYGGYDRSPFGSSYPGELILVARRGA
ncbi:MAG TPA: class I SAM-dependent methyltransferase [Gemmatimonadales bacterium]|nr:class I SAM-dependent methyltransferase [Gemmatimonadales bacterium]